MVSSLLLWAIFKPQRLLHLYLLWGLFLHSLVSALNSASKPTSQKPYLATSTGQPLRVATNRLAFMFCKGQRPISICWAQHSWSCCVLLEENFKGSLKGACLYTDGFLNCHSCREASAGAGCDPWPSLHCKEEPYRRQETWVTSYPASSQFWGLWPVRTISEPWRGARGIQLIDIPRQSRQIGKKGTL